MSEIRAIAFYLPQFHPIPENDKWWGNGFTEWTNVTKAKPLFKGHSQPNFPADLGYYDLRVPEAREAQAKLARKYGIEGFCYWHYWFGNGKIILERPFTEVLETGKPDFPFCLGWANETWTGIWHGNPKTILIEQKYPGVEDYINHFNYLLKAFRDPRYIQVDEKPLFVINSPESIPDIIEFTDLFRQLAVKNGLKGLYIVANTGSETWNPIKNGCDAVNLILHGNLYRGIPANKKLLYSKYKNQLIKNETLSKIYRYFRKRPAQIYNYSDITDFLVTKKTFNYDAYPCVLPNWDNSPRSGINSMIFKNATPEAFERHLLQAVDLIKDNGDDKKIIFIKSWNEWAEGNYLEPDTNFGTKYLEVIRKHIKI
ncbi:glycoside hydrolase family 99-like domain-containing protein [Pedobacter aquatilis]|uniref:glycosyltransferase WbsX family protein n=1 Tax=Pedobacter aquatilis TaxID=351343 RepID=UPI00292D3218|nr:glycoside hydrolase family 99-like domain-containing protein [Pedobacter aquatilis]